MHYLLCTKKGRAAGFTGVLASERTRLRHQTSGLAYVKSALSTEQRHLLSGGGTCSATDRASDEPRTWDAGASADASAAAASAVLPLPNGRSPSRVTASSSKHHHCPVTSCCARAPPARGRLKEQQTQRDRKPRRLAPALATPNPRPAWPLIGRRPRRTLPTTRLERTSSLGTRRRPMNRAARRGSLGNKQQRLAINAHSEGRKSRHGEPRMYDWLKILEILCLWGSFKPDNIL